MATFFRTERSSRPDSGLRTRRSGSGKAVGCATSAKVNCTPTLRQGDELARANAQLAAYRRYGMHKVLKRIETAMDETWKEAQEEA